MKKKLIAQIQFIIGIILILTSAIIFIFEIAEAGVGTVILIVGIIAIATSKFRLHK